PVLHRPLSCSPHPPPPATYTLSLHDALPISHLRFRLGAEEVPERPAVAEREHGGDRAHLQGLGELLVLVDVHLDELEAAGVFARSEEHTSELQSRVDLVCRLLLEKKNKRNNR